MKQHELFKSIYASNLKSRAINVMSCLITYMNTADNTCFPSINTIARCCSISVNTVKRALNDLVAAGFVEKEARFIEAKNGAQTSNLYRLSAVFTAPEPPADADSASKEKPQEVVTFEGLQKESEAIEPHQAQLSNESASITSTKNKPFVPKKSTPENVKLAVSLTQLPPYHHEQRWGIISAQAWAAPKPTVIPP